jgi:hypothetical protein
MTMNIFKALSNILDAAVTTTVKACDVIDTSVSAIDNVAKMAERTTNTMLEEQQEEARQSLLAFRSKSS